MRINKRLATSLSFALLLHVLPTTKAQDVEFVVAELGGVTVVSIPQPSPIPELLATKVVLRSAPGSKLVTFENVSISGALHQIFVPSTVAPQPTPFVDLRPSSPWSAMLQRSEWVDSDSHLLISPDMVDAESAQGHYGMTETSDFANPVGANESLPRLVEGLMLPPISGIGDTEMRAESDAFSLLPDVQSNEIDFAFIATPSPSTGAAGDVFLTVGVLGEGIINSGESGGSSFGFNGNNPVVIPFVPEPSAASLAVFAMMAVTCLRMPN